MVVTLALIYQKKKGVSVWKRSVADVVRLYPSTPSARPVLGLAKDPQDFQSSKSNADTAARFARFLRVERLVMLRKYSFCLS